MQNKSNWIALLALCLFPLGLCAQGYTLQKLVMTGDDVPGETVVTEQFAYFQNVHVFPDGQVGFSGITTRTGNFFRNAPRGIYLSNTSGTLSVLAEIDDAEAWRSFGLPYNELDSDVSKNFAFNYVNPTFVPWVQGLAKTAPGQEVLSLSPEDGSFMLVSSANLPDATFYQGIFSEIWGGIMLNSQGQVLALADFEFTNDPDNDKRGLFVASGVNDIRNIAFAGDAAPGFVDASFFDFVNPVLADNGNVFFKSTLTGAGVSSPDNETLWMENDGTFTLLLREGSPAPGRPVDHEIRLTSLNMQVIAINGNKMVVFAGASPPGGGLHRVFWISDTQGTDLSPIFHYNSSPVLSNPDYFTATDQGSVAFTSIDGNTIIMDNNGNVYFEGGGEFENEQNIGGVWKYSASDGSISLIQESSIDNGGLYAIDLLAVNNFGGLLFHARDSGNSGTKGIWTRRPSGALNNLSNVGDKIDDRPITGYAVHSGITTLGSPRKHTLMTDGGDCVFVATLADTANDSDNRFDEAIMLATAPILPTERYLWNGGGGDKDWHKVLSWEDLDISTPATRIPGDEAGTEVVVINDREVEINDRSVHLKELTASGGVTLQQSLTLEADSTIENIFINADITTAGELTLKGQALFWHSGDLQGSGSFVLDPNSWLTMSKPGANLNLKTEFDVGGYVEHANTTLNITGVGSKLTTTTDGTFEMTSGTITDDTDGVNFENFGEVRKLDLDTATIDAFFENMPDSRVLVNQGTLEFTDPSNWAGTLMVTNGASVVFDLSPVLLGAPGGEDFQAVGTDPENAGIIQFSKSEVLVSSGATATFDLRGMNGKVEVVDQAHFYGDGALLNKGNFEHKDGSFEAWIRNQGLFIVDGPTAMIESDVENSATFILQGEGTIGIGPEQEDLFIDNLEDGELIKEGSGNFDIYHHVNSEGDIIVNEGSLTFWKKLSLGEKNDFINTVAAIEILEQAQLILGEEGDLKIEFNAAKNRILGLGTEGLCVINAFDAVLGSGDQLFLESDTQWKRGAIRSSTTGDSNHPNLQVGSQFYPVTLTIEHPESTPEVVLGDNLTSKPIFALVSKGSTIIQNTPLSLWGVIQVDGTYNLNETTISKFNLASNASALVVTTDGELFVSGISSIGENLENGLVPLNVLGRGQVTIKENSRLNLFGLNSIKDGFPGKKLDAGFWFLESNAVINMPDTVNTQINGIGNAAIYMSPGSRFSNLPDVAGDFTNEGVLTLDGVTFSPSGKFTNKESAGVYFINGILEGTLFENRGIANGTGNITCPVFNYGTMSPGLSPGTLTIEGDFTQDTDGELIIELAAGQPGTDYDQLNITGTATLGGTLTIDCLDDAFPENDTTFAAIVASSFSGDFDQVVVNLPSSRQTFDVGVEGSELVARATTLNISTFSGWTMGVFTDSEQADEAITGMNANPDGDDYSNLLEYVFDTNPKLESDSQVETHYSYDLGRPTEVHVVFPWANDVTDATFTLQRSNDMITWVDLPSTVTGSVDEGVVTRTTLTATLPNENPIYVRLLVSLP
ncbi:MAG: choice-of-anchor tandem repeat NxxGxxAF-containing protein [Puniceicoccaceae bacterium]